MIEKDDQNMNKSNNFNQNSDNEYGLPEAEYSPITREHQDVPVEPVAYNSSFNEKKPEPPQKSSSWPMWLALVVVLLMAGFFVYFLLTGGEDEKVAVKPPVSAAPVVVVEEEETPVQPEEEWTTPEPEVAEGSVSTISSRTGRYYMIVGSFIDSDLAGDYAQKLADNGVSAKIIEPFGTRKFYRLSVKDSEGIEDLTDELTSVREKFGENVWIVKY